MEWNGMEKAADIRPCPLSAGGRVSFCFSIGELQVPRIIIIIGVYLKNHVRNFWNTSSEGKRKSGVVMNSQI